jgi:hypothetical protein
MAKKINVFYMSFVKLFVIWTSKFITHEGLMNIMVILSNWGKKSKHPFEKSLKIGYSAIQYTPHMYIFDA